MTQRQLPAYLPPTDAERAMTVDPDQRVSDRASKHMVKIQCFNAEDQLVREGSGCLITDQEELILTSAFVARAPGVHKIKATYASDNTTEDVSEDPNSAPDNVLNVALLVGTRKAPVTLWMTAPRFSLPAYAVGYKLSSSTLTFSQATIASKGPLNITLDAESVDDGLIGGPIFSMEGGSMGMVQRGSGDASLQPQALTHAGIQLYLTLNKQPLLLVS